MVSAINYCDSYNIRVQHIHVHLTFGMGSSCTKSIVWHIHSEYI